MKHKQKVAIARNLFIIMLASLFLLTPLSFPIPQTKTLGNDEKPDSLGIVRSQTPRTPWGDLQSAFSHLMSWVLDSGRHYGYWLPSNIPNVYGTTTFGITSVGSSGYGNYPQYTQTIYGYSASSTGWNGYAWFFYIDTGATARGTVFKLGVNVPATGGGNVRMAIYDNSSGPNNRLMETESTTLVTGWNDLWLGSYVYITSSTRYWLAVQFSSSTTQPEYVNNTDVRGYIVQAYGAFPTPASETQQSTITGHILMRITYSYVKGYATCTKATGAAGVGTSVSFYAHATGNYRLGIYTDSSGPTSSPVWELGSTAVSGAPSWQTTNISSGTPTSYTFAVVTYWLCWQVDTVNSVPSYASGAGSTGARKAQDYGAFTSGGFTLSTENWSMYVTLASADFSMSNSGNKAVSQTGSVTNSITATNIAGNLKVTMSCLSGLPTGGSCAFSPNGNAATYSSTLTITTSSSPAGAYTITVQGANGTLTHTTAFTLTVSSLSLVPSGSINIIAGYSGGTTITVRATSAISIALFCQSGLPAGATCGLGPQTANANFTSTLSISTTPATLGGTYSIVLLGNSSATQTTAIVTLRILDFGLSSVSNLVVNQGDSLHTFNNWLTITSTSIGSPSSTVSGTFSGMPSGVSFSSFGPYTIPGTTVFTLYVNASESTIAGAYPIILSITGANQTHTVSFALLIIMPIITVTNQFNQTVTSIIAITVSTTTSSVTTSTFTQPVATRTLVLTQFTTTDIPIAIYGMALLLVLTPTFLVLMVNKTVAGLLIAMSTGIVWAVTVGVLNIFALLLLVGLAALALLFRVRGNG